MEMRKALPAAAVIVLAAVCLVLALASPGRTGLVYSSTAGCGHPSVEPPAAKETEHSYSFCCNHAFSFSHCWHVTIGERVDYWATAQDLHLTLLPTESQSSTAGSWTDGTSFAAEGTAVDNRASVTLRFAWKITSRQASYTAEVSLHYERLGGGGGSEQGPETSSPAGLSNNALLTWLSLDILGLDNLVRLANGVGDRGLSPANRVADYRVSKAIRLQIDNLGFARLAKGGLPGTENNWQPDGSQSVVVWRCSLVGDPSDWAHSTYKWTPSYATEQEIEKVGYGGDWVILRIAADRNDPQGGAGNEGVAYVLVPESVLVAYTTEGAVQVEPH